MKLSNRLNTIFEMFEGNVAADVGSDHGKLIISLYQNKKIKKGYAIENKKGPYSRLCKEIENNQLSNEIISMFSDGISELPSDVDSVIVAGMGGSLIIDILNSHRDNLYNVNYIYIDAHNNVPEVRRFITALGYSIYKERIIKESGIYYEIIGFKKDKNSYLNDLDYQFGPILRKEKSKIFVQKQKDRILEINNILSKPNLPGKKIDELVKEKNVLEEVIS